MERTRSAWHRPEDAQCMAPTGGLHGTDQRANSGSAGLEAFLLRSRLLSGDLKRRAVPGTDQRASNWFRNFKRHAVPGTDRRASGIAKGLAAYYLRAKAQCSREECCKAMGPPLSVEQERSTTVEGWQATIFDSSARWEASTNPPNQGRVGSPSMIPRTEAIASFRNPN